MSRKLTLSTLINARTPEGNTGQNERNILLYMMLHEVRIKKRLCNSSGRVFLRCVG